MPTILLYKELIVLNVTEWVNSNKKISKSILRILSKEKSRPRNIHNLLKGLISLVRNHPQHYTKKTPFFNISTQKTSYVLTHFHKEMSKGQKILNTSLFLKLILDNCILQGHMQTAVLHWDLSFLEWCTTRSTKFL